MDGRDGPGPIDKGSKAATANAMMEGSGRPLLPLRQFVRPENGLVAFQLTILGVVFVLFGLLSTVVYAVSAGCLGDFLRRKPTVLKWQGKAIGAVYCALGARLALERR